MLCNSQFDARIQNCGADVSFSTINSSGRYIGSQLCLDWKKKTAKMIGQRSVVLVLLLCLVAGTESNSEQTGPVCNGTDQQLMNTVVDQGNPSSFSNQPDPNGVKWENLPMNSNSSFTIADSNSVQQAFVKDYTVNLTQLNILEVVGFNYFYPGKPTTAGFYTLTYKTDGCQSMANLISVANNGPQCYCYPEENSDKARVSCSMDYTVTNKYPNKVNLTWTTDSGKALSGREESETSPTIGNIARSYHYVTSSDASNFTCVATFGEPQPSGPPNMATNAPSYYKSCTVKNCANNVTVKADGPPTGRDYVKTETVKEEKSPKGNCNKVCFEFSSCGSN